MGRRSDHTPRQITAMALDAARHLVIEQGLTGLSARKIAARIGYSAGTLYTVFDNLDDLILRLNALTLDELYERMHQSLDGCSDARHSLLTLGRIYARFAEQQPHLWSALFEHRLPPGTAIPEDYRVRIDRLFGLTRHQLQILGKHVPDRQIDIAAHALWSGIHGICILQLSGTLQATGSRTVTELLDSLIENYLDGWLQ